MKRIGENVRFYRNLRGLTQTALARQVHVAPAYISQIEANQRVPSLKVTRRIADVLGIDMSVLVRETDPRAAEGQLSDSEKLDLLRTLMLSIERGGQARKDEERSRTARGSQWTGTQLHSEPAYCVWVRDFDGPVEFGRESAEATVESHLVLEGEVEILDRQEPAVLRSGDSHVPREGGARLRGRPGARVLSVYAPRLSSQELAPSPEENAEVSPGSRSHEPRS